MLRKSAYLIRYPLENNKKMNSSGKICIFCGEKPNSKNKEHVIPIWLMEYIGIAGKVVRFGFNKITGKPREFSYKSFTFPACEKCNSLFSNLERKTKPIILKLLDEKPLSKNDFYILLDWFDKVRIGLWLGFYYLDKNYGGISPHFHISNRITTQDRMLHIIKVDNDKNELSFRGCDSIAFHFVPSCFSMIINNYCFYNISSPFLIARRIGFPYPIESYMREDGLTDYILVPGRNRVMSPILKRYFAFQGTSIYQPIFKSAISDQDMSFYDNEYVKSRCLSLKKGIGDILFQKNGSVIIYPNRPSKDWIPQISYERRTMNPNISISTLEYQLYIYSQQPSISNLSKSEQTFWKNNYSVAKKDATWFIKTMRINANKDVF